MRNLLRVSALVAVCAGILAGSASAQATKTAEPMYMRISCAHPAHGGGRRWVWISEIMVVYALEDCWRVARQHNQGGHEARCSWVNQHTGERQ